MRHFVILAHDVPLHGSFSLDDLPGQGRLDLLCRCLADAVLVSHGIRDDVTVSLVLDDEYTLRFEGDSLRGLQPDERSTAARIRDALAQRDEAVGHVPVETSPGVFLTAVGLDATLDALPDAIGLYQLHEDGDPIPDVDVPTDAVFVLSDHREFSDEDETILVDHRDRRLSVGPAAIHANQAISVVHNWLDTDGFDSY